MKSVKYFNLNPDGWQSHNFSLIDFFETSFDSRRDSLGSKIQIKKEKIYLNWQPPYEWGEKFNIDHTKGWLIQNKNKEKKNKFLKEVKNKASEDRDENGKWTSPIWY